MESVEAADVVGRSLVEENDERILVNDGPRGRVEERSETGRHEGRSYEHVTSFEDLLDVVGTNEWFNYFILFMCCWCTFVSAEFSVSYQFFGATPDYWCDIPPLREANWTGEQIMKISSPFSETTHVYDGCRMYVKDYGRIAEVGYEEAVAHPDLYPSSGIESCSKRDFQSGEKSVVTEWDLVCERRFLYSTTQSSLQIGWLIGSMINGIIIDFFGRRSISVTCTFIAFPLGIAKAFVGDIYTYLVLHVLFAALTITVYLGSFVLCLELCSKKQRSFVGNLFVMPWALGYIATPIVAYFVRDWRWLQITFSMTLITLFPNLWVLPESPRWLILCRRYDEAYRVLRLFASRNGREFPAQKEAFMLFRRIHAENAEEQKGRVGLAQCSPYRNPLHSLFLLFSPRLRFQTVVVFICWFSTSLVYYGVSLNATNISTSPYLYILLGGILEVPAYLILPPAVTLLGRRRTLFVFFIVCSFSILSVMAVMLSPLKGVTWLLITLSLVGKFCITSSFHLVWVYTGELFPTELRSLAIGEAGVCARVGSFFSPYINDILSLASEWSPSASFGVFSLLAALVVLPLRETTDAELPDQVSTIADSDTQNDPPEGGDSGQGEVS